MGKKTDDKQCVWIRSHRGVSCVAKAKRREEEGKKHIRNRKLKVKSLSQN
jgi:hypothetical protein